MSVLLTEVKKRTPDRNEGIRITIIVVFVLNRYAPVDALGSLLAFNLIAAVRSVCRFQLRTTTARALHSY
jgi:hypothetical protein